MDELKHKFLDLLNKGHYSQQPLSSPKLELVVNTSQDDQISIVKESQNNALIQTEVEPLADQEILESIEQHYFTDSNFDPCEHVLREVPEILDCASIEAESEKIQKQLKVVSNNVLRLILHKQSICNDEFERILEIQEELQSTLKICQVGRSNLFLAKHQFTTASLGILANYRKRQVVQGLLHYLQTIKTLQRTDERLQELLSEGDYPSAIRLLLECQNAAATYKHFTCVAALSGKLQDTLEMAEEQLDQALSQVCKHFDADHYSKVHSAYKLLGKMQMAMDQMHMHFASAIHNSAFNVVHGYVELCFVQTHGEDTVVLHKKQFRELCKFVTAESFIPCLIDLCKALWEIMKSYHKVIIWQQRNDSDKLTADGAMEKVDFEASFNKEYVKQKLENGLARIWQDVQSRISVYLLGSDLAWYKFDEFLQVLGIVHRLMEVGEEFCGSKSIDLQNSIRTQSMNYFINYHQSRLDELRIFLENEGWEICPVKPNFTILRLQEFGSLCHILKYWKNIDLSSQGQLNMSSPECSSNHSQDDSSLSGGYFARYSDSGSPFDISQDEVQEEDILANIGLQDEPSGYFSDESDEDIPEELTKDFVDENMGDTVSNKHSKPTYKKNIHVELLKAPILTNTALTVLRQCGKYLQMSHLLRPIACDVITCMSQLFEYYLYTVYSFFANDLPVSCNSMLSLKLQATLKRIKDKLIISDHVQEQKLSEINKRKILPPQISTGVELNQAESLYGLAERVVAVESLVFLAKQFKFLQSYLEHLIPHSSPVTGNSAPLHHFYSQTILVATELRRPVYMHVCARAVDFNTTLNAMAKVNWEVKEVMSQHSQYVDNLLRDLQIFSMRLEEVSCRVPLSPDILNILWENVAYLCCNTFVEGFSNAKKCSNGGRALMQLDFTQFLSKFEKLTSIKPIPNREFVEAYVKAYYQPDTELETWIKEHSEYSTKQLLALVNCSCHNNKKARQHLFSLLEELEKVNR